MVKRSNQKRFFMRLNSKGVSIIEVLVAAGLMAIVSLGIATVMQNMAYEQKRNNLLNTLRELETKIEGNIRDPGSWASTLDNNTGPIWTALRAKTAVTENSPTSPDKIILYNVNNVPVFDLLSWTATTGNGFTESGMPCNTFTTAGNDACPISYRMVFTADCGATATSCNNPLLKIVGRLVFAPNPAGAGYLKRFTKIVGAITVPTIADTPVNSPNPSIGKYDILVRRTATEMSSMFRIVSRKTGSTAGVGSYGLAGSNCTGNGAGQCTTGSDGLHPMTTTVGWTELEDPSNLVTATSGAGAGTFTIDQPGIYECKISMLAFGTTVKGYLYRGTTLLGSGTGVAGQWGTSVLDIQTRFTHTAASPLTATFSIRQSCESWATAVTGSDSGVSYCSLGFALSPYTVGTFTDLVTVDCVQNIQ